MGDFRICALIGLIRSNEEDEDGLYIKVVGGNSGQTLIAELGKTADRL